EASASSVWGKVGNPKGCPSRARARRHFPRRSPVSRAVDNLGSSGCRGILLVVGWVGVNGVGVDPQLDAGWQGLADVEAPGALPIIPVEGVPVRTMTGSSGWALAAVGFATADVLLAVDDTIRPAGSSAEIGPPGFRQRHVDSLHKRHGRLPRSARAVDDSPNH